VIVVGACSDGPVAPRSDLLERPVEALSPVQPIVELIEVADGRAVFTADWTEWSGRHSTAWSAGPRADSAPVTSADNAFGSAEFDLPIRTEAYQATFAIFDRETERGLGSTTFIVPGTPSNAARAPSNRPPVAAFTVSCVDRGPTANCSFDASTSSDPDGTIVRYDWTFGDGTIGTGKSVSHAYTRHGLYTVKLTVTDNRGAKGTRSQKVIALADLNVPPLPDFTISCRNLMCRFDASRSFDLDGSISEYAWDFQNDGSFDVVGPSNAADHTYSAAGTYRVRLRVTDDEGARTSRTRDVTVTAPPNSPPVADAGSDLSVTDVDLSGAEDVRLSGAASTDSDGTIVSYIWTAGGSQIAAGVNPTVDRRVGTHTITLTVTDDDGATSSDEVVVSIEPGNQVPIADAGPDQNLIDANNDTFETVTLDGSRSTDLDGTILSYLWTVDGGQIAAGMNPTVDRRVGTHTITLTVTDNDGATATDEVVITVKEGQQAPIANAGEDQQHDDANNDAFEPVTLDGSRSTDLDGTIVSYLWMEGGEQIAAGVSPTLDRRVGTHTITLTATDNDGATATDEVVITVAPNQAPTADAGRDQTVMDSDNSGDEAVTLDGSWSFDPNNNGTIEEYGWVDEIGNVIALGPRPTVTLPIGTHAIRLLVQDNGLAWDEDEVTVTVTPYISCLPPAAGLVGWWPGDGNADDIAGSHHGSLRDEATFAPGRVGQAFSFDGSGDSVDLPGTWGGGPEITLNAWVMTQGSTGNFQAILEPGATEFVHLQLAPFGNNVVYADQGEVWLPIIGDSPTAVWRHIALSSKSGDTRLYVDGVLVDDGSLPNTLAFDHITTTSDLFIGQGYQGGRFFRGLIDEVQIHSRALTGAEVQAIHAAGPNGQCKL
jgi:PKD repeat protein